MQALTSFFVSDRERRLWRWVAIVTVGIFLSLGFARRWAGAIQANGLAEVSFVLALLMVVVAIIAYGVKFQPGKFELGAWLGVLAVLVLVCVRVTIPAERTHLVEYGILALLLNEALHERTQQGRSVPFPSCLAVLMASGIGVFDELVQAVLPSRVFDVRDMVFNLLAAVLAVSARNLLRWARRIDR